MWMYNENGPSLNSLNRSIVYVLVYEVWAWFVYPSFDSCGY